MPSKKKMPVLTEELLEKYIAFEKRMRAPNREIGEQGLVELRALQGSGEAPSSPAFDALFEGLADRNEQHRREASEASGIALSECDWIRSLAQGVLRARRDPAYPAARAIPRSMRAPTLAELSGTYGSKNVALVLANEARLAEVLPAASARTRSGSSASD